MLPSTKQYAKMLEKHPSNANLQASQIVSSNHLNQLDGWSQMRNAPSKHPAVSLNVQLRSVTRGDRSQFGSSSLPRSARQLVQLDKLGKRYAEVSLRSTRSEPLSSPLLRASRSDLLIWALNSSLIQSGRNPIYWTAFVLKRDVFKEMSLSSRTLKCFKNKIFLSEVDYSEYLVWLNKFCLSSIIKSFICLVRRQPWT